MPEMTLATDRGQVQLAHFTDNENFSKFKPHQIHEKSANNMLDEVIAWAGALKILRTR
jgi:hypothetical protein